MRAIPKHPKFVDLEFVLVYLWYFLMLQEGGKYTYFVLV